MPEIVNISALNQAVSSCASCPELRTYCNQIALAKRRAFMHCTYWAKPVPSFGDRQAKIMIIGLAPAAHGANRTGRMFTGDRSGDFLYAALHRAGLANQPTSRDRDDGLKLAGVYITAAARCAPPQNKPTALQLERCRRFLVEEFALLQPRVLMCLGGIAWNATLAALRELPAKLPKPLPKFSHGAECELERFTMLGCYHVSQQNTFTGRLTERMIDAVVNRAKSIAGLS